MYPDEDLMITIGQFSFITRLSPRMLRIYDEKGLLTPKRHLLNNYRYYTADQIETGRRIRVLSCMGFEYAEIGEILGHLENLPASQDRIDALFVKRMMKTHAKIQRLKEVEAVLMGKTALEVLSMTEQDKSIKEQKMKDVRIVRLPPATVATSHYVGKEPEFNASKILDRFVRESGLYNIKPDLRHYGFNHPNPSQDKPGYGYERWVTIPDDLDVPEPMTKKNFGGGLYAAYRITFGKFHEWSWLFDWVQNNSTYVSNKVNDGGECMYGLLEEHLNYRDLLGRDIEDYCKDMVLDLLYPVKVKE